MFLVLFFGYITYLVLKPFVGAISWGIVLSLVFYPVYSFLLRYVKNSTISSVITLLLIISIILGPFMYLAYLITQEINLLIDYIKSHELTTLDKILQYPLIKGITKKILNIFNMTQAELKKAIITNLTELGKDMLGRITSNLGNIISVLIDIVFVFLTVFFLLLDGPKFLNKIQDYMPFSKNQKEKLIKQIKDIIISTIYGGVTVAFIQGLIGGISFSILGIQSAVFWGLCMFFASFVPILGTFIIWGPAAAYLFLNGFILKGFILILIGIFIISMVDNILRPLIVKGKTKLPTILIFFSILGGIKLFGFIGFIMGPLILALFISLFEIFRYSEYKEKL
ncbi:MAG: AI-2E family transporter [Syntrophorhabdaceae bacterium]|nr:AI-2E family transporter [Syntrophorhabdaceae bacterium]